MGNKNSIAAGPAGVATMMATANSIQKRLENQQSTGGNSVLKNY